MRWEWITWCLASNANTSVEAAQKYGAKRREWGIEACCACSKSMQYASWNKWCAKKYHVIAEYGTQGTKRFRKQRELEHVKKKGKENHPTDNHSQENSGEKQLETNQTKREGEATQGKKT